MAPGRTFSASRNGVRHAFEPPHGYHKLEKHRFMATLADALDDACGRRAFDDLILVAPCRSLGELRGLLSKRVQGILPGGRQGLDRRSAQPAAPSVAVLAGREDRIPSPQAAARDIARPLLRVSLRPFEAGLPRLDRGEGREGPPRTLPPTWREGCRCRRRDRPVAAC